MFKSWITKFLIEPPPKVAFECKIRDIEREGYIATACSKCDGTRAKVLIHASGRVSSVCSACGCSVFTVEPEETGE